MVRFRRLLVLAVVAALPLSTLALAGDASADVVFGNAAIAPQIDTDAAGSAEAFVVTAAASGSVSSLNVYVDASSASTAVSAGLYTNVSGRPGSLLTQGKVTGPVTGAWNTLSVAPTSITAGTTYWIAILGTGGKLAFRDQCCVGTASAINSSQSNLTTLPTTWTSGATWSDGLVSVFGSGTAPPPPPSSQLGQWSSVVSLPLVAIHSVLLRTGRVLMMDGWQTPNQSQVFNPADQTMVSASNGLGLDLFCVGNATLADGRVLIVGGDSSETHSINATTIFDPATNQWSAVAPLNTPRWYPTVNELPDGRLLAISGSITTSSWADTPEIYDPARNTWTSLPSISTQQVHEDEYPLSFELPNGTVFTIAPTPGQAYELDPTVPSWSSVAGATLKFGTAAQYRPGQILYSGGGPSLGETTSAQNAAQIIDTTTATPTWHATGSMTSPRYTHTLTVLPDGKVLAVGGTNVMDDLDSSKAVLPAEEWDPATGAWTALASMSVPRMYHSTAVLLPDARVLVAGSGHDENVTGPGEYSAQYYSPPYLFNGARPTISSAPSSASYGSKITVQTPDAASISSVALVSLGADTHTLDMNQHFVPLSFTAGTGSLSVQIPASAATAPPGYYMLFLVNGAGVPSVASMLQVTSSNSPPTVAVTAPVSGATVSGSSAPLTATASDPTGISGVQFFVDGAPVGPRLTAAPYTTTWNSNTVANGSHTVTAQATNGSGIVGSSAPVPVTVSNTAPAGPVIDARISVEGNSTLTTPPMSTTQPGDVLVAFASSDGPINGQTLGVTGGGVTWSLVKRSNGQLGTTEIWTAAAPTQLSNATFTTTQTSKGFDQALQVIAFRGAKGVGASAVANSRTGKPTVGLTTTAGSSWVFGSGNDYDNAIARTLASGQTLQYQWVDTLTGDTYWVQSTAGPTSLAGTAVTISDAAPTADRWNMAAVEVLSQ